MEADSGTLTPTPPTDLVAFYFRTFVLCERGWGGHCGSRGPLVAVRSSTVWVPGIEVRLLGLQVSLRMKIQTSCLDKVLCS